DPRDFVARQRHGEPLESEPEELGWRRLAIDRRDELFVGDAHLSRRRRLPAARGRASQKPEHGRPTVRFAFVLAALAGASASAQPQVPAQLPTDITAIRHNSGQPVIPYFEGWIKNPDGTHDLVFGYFNRN